MGTVTLENSLAVAQKGKHKLAMCPSGFTPRYLIRGFPGGSDGEESACNAGDPGSTPGLGRSPREGNGNPLQHSCLENPLDRGACQATVHGVTELDMTE